MYSIQLVPRRSWSDRGESRSRKEVAEHLCLVSDAEFGECDVGWTVHHVLHPTGWVPARSDSSNSPHSRTDIARCFAEEGWVNK